MPKLSIIVAAYNVGEFLDKCLSSINNQLMDEIEVIVVDDGSKDNTGEIGTKYGEIENFKYIRQENQGVSVARNTGIRNSDGEWITFIDGDDFVDNSYCEKIINLINNYDSDMFVFNYKGIFTDRIVEYRTLPFSESLDITSKKDLFQKRMISQYYLGGDSKTIVSSGTCWAKVIKKSILDDYNIEFVPGLIKAQDTVFWLNVTEKAKSIYFLNECLYCYRLTNTSISSGNKYIDNSISIFNELISKYRYFIEANGKDISYYEAFYLRCIQILMWNVDHNFFNKNNLKPLSKRISELRNLCESTVFKEAIVNVKNEELPRRLRFMHKFLFRKFYYCYYYFNKLYDLISKYKNKRW